MECFLSFEEYNATGTSHNFEHIGDKNSFICKRIVGQPHKRILTIALHIHTNLHINTHIYGWTNLNIVNHFDIDNFVDQK